MTADAIARSPIAPAPLLKEINFAVAAEDDGVGKACSGVEVAPEDGGGNAEGFIVKVKSPILDHSVWHSDSFEFCLTAKRCPQSTVSASIRDWESSRPKHKL
jgi:hypothetical protein